jgi:6-pyruvoyl-tetrahydropterin synthase-like protein
MPFRGDASGHDFLFHLASWMDVAGQWREGIVYPRWAEWANWGFGEPRFVFYPPGSWMIGAVLGSVLPWKMAPATFIWLVLVAAGMSMWKFAREWLPGWQAATAAMLYMANPYHLVIVYYRSAFGELLACALLPLLLLSALRAGRGERRGIPLLAIIFCASWLSNGPAAVIATYALSVVFVVLCAVRSSLRPLISGAMGLAAGFGLAAFYILPAAWERRWVQIGEVLAGNLHPAQNFLFTSASDTEFVLFNWKVSSVAVALMCVTGIAVALAARRRCEFPEAFWMVAALGAAATVLMLRPSLVLWQHLPELEFVQFPWRWLGVLGAAFAFFFAAAIGKVSKRWVAWSALGILGGAIAAAGVAMVRDAWWDTQGAPFLTNAIRTARGYEGADEYQPNDSDRSELPGNPDDETRMADASATPAAPIEKLNSDFGKIVPARGVRIHISKWSAEQKIFTAAAPAPVTLALRLVGYPAWEARVDGVAADFDSQPVTAQLLLPLPAGAHRVEVRFRRTWDRTVGGAISALTAIVLAVFTWGVGKWRGAS